MRVDCTCRHCGEVFAVEKPSAVRPFCSRACKDQDSRDSFAATLAQRFWAKVDQSAIDGCWPWLGATTNGGYGVVNISQTVRRASQVAWELANGEPFPPRMDACHTCDNPPCVRPDHIFPGTKVDNGKDAAAKGRNHNPALTHPERLVRGSAAPWSKLTEATVLALRSDPPANWATVCAAAARLGVSPSAIYDVIQGRTWRQVA